MPSDTERVMLLCQYSASSLGHIARLAQKALNGNLVGKSCSTFSLSKGMNLQLINLDMQPRFRYQDLQRESVTGDGECKLYRPMSSILSDTQRCYRYYL